MDYGRVVDDMSRTTRKMISRYFGFPTTPRRLWQSLRDAEFCQADVVLALLRMNLLRDAEALVGRPITHCPPALRSGSRTPVLRAPDPVIAIVYANPRAPGTEAHERYHHFRVGRTVAQARARGARRRDVRMALRRGWIVLVARTPEVLQ